MIKIKHVESAELDSHPHFLNPNLVSYSFELTFIFIYLASKLKIFIK